MQVTELSQSETLKNDEQAQKTYGSQLLAYRAVRVYYLARSHAAFRRWKESTALFALCKEYIGQIKERKFPEELFQLLKSVEENVDVEIASAKANYVLEQTEAVSVPVPQKVKQLILHFFSITYIKVLFFVFFEV